MGSDPFIGRIKPACQIVIGELFCRNRPPGSDNFNSHALTFYDKTSIFVIKLIYRIEKKCQGNPAQGNWFCAEAISTAGFRAPGRGTAVSQYEGFAFHGPNLK
jgi:hypothetical protein